MKVTNKLKEWGPNLKRKVEQKLTSDYASVFREYHKHIEVIISEQNILLDDVYNFINDLSELKKES